MCQMSSEFLAEKLAELAEAALPIVYFLPTQVLRPLKQYQGSEGYQAAVGRPERHRIIGEYSFMVGLLPRLRPVIPRMCRICLLTTDLTT